MKRKKEYVEEGNDHRRGARYRDKDIRCPNASSFGKHTASRGDMVKYFYEMDDGSREYHWGRMMARVDAPALSKDICEVTEHLCVLELAWGGHVGFVRWISRQNVVEVRELPRSLPAWFYQEELPEIADVLAADRHGSLAEPYIDRWTAEQKSKTMPRKENA